MIYSWVVSRITFNMVHTFFPILINESFLLAHRVEEKFLIPRKQGDNVTREKGYSTLSLPKPTMLCCYFETRIVPNYPDENKIYLGVANTHLQHTILDTAPTIRLDPSSTLGSTKTRWVYLKFNVYGTSAKLIPESNKADKNP